MVPGFLSKTTDAISLQIQFLSSYGDLIKTEHLCDGPFTL